MVQVALRALPTSDVSIQFFLFVVEASPVGGMLYFFIKFQFYMAVEILVVLPWV